MHRKVLIGALAVLGLLVMASPATAARRPHRYSPRHGAKCRKGYKRIRHGRHVYCVRRHVKRSPVTPPAPPTTTEQVKLHAHLDPSYTRNPLDPFQVTYAYSASATSQTFSAMATPVGTEAPAPLPAGVLSFYSDGTLECAINVGSGVEGSECPVTYKALGEHRVTTIYSSGEQSATATEAEDITPLATTTTLSVGYVPLAEPQRVTPTLTEEKEGASAVMHIGDLSIQMATSPENAPAPMLMCRSEIESEATDTEGCYQLDGLETAHVYEQNCAGGERVFISDATRPWSVDNRVAGDVFSKTALEAGSYHLRAISRESMGQAGYEESEATGAIRFIPDMVPTC